MLTSAWNWLQRRREPVVVGFVGGLALLVGLQVLPLWDRFTGQCHRAGCEFDGPESTLVELINAQRVTASCPDVTRRLDLDALAQQQVIQALDRRSVAGLADRASWPSQARSVGYRGAIEKSLAIGLPTPQAVVARWLEMGGSTKARLADCRWRSVGVAFGPGRLGSSFGPGVWIVIFGDQ